VDFVFFQVDAALETAFLAESDQIAIDTARITQQVVIGLVGALRHDEILSYINNVIRQKQLFDLGDAETIECRCLHLLKFSAKVYNIIELCIKNRENFYF
jgi:DNA polymerase III gamma/tau subunit